MPKKARNYRLGLWAENLAAFALRIKGYRILAKRHKTPVGEIDLIARRGNQIAFVEVKARKDAQTGLDSVSRTAQNRIESAAQLWLSRQSDFTDLSWRFDVVVVSPWQWPKHFTDVW